MKHLTIKDIMPGAMVLVARDPVSGEGGCGHIPEEYIQDLFMVRSSTPQTLYFSYEDDENMVIRVRRFGWLPIGIRTFDLKPEKPHIVKMTRDLIGA